MKLNLTLKTEIEKILFVLVVIFSGSAYAQQCTPEVGTGLCPGNPPNRIDLLSMCGDDPATANLIEFKITYNDSSPDGYACAFFDTDGDGNANFAACVSSTGTQ